MDKFEDMITEVDRVELAANLKYAMLLQFVNRLEKSGKIGQKFYSRLRTCRKGWEESHIQEQEMNKNLVSDPITIAVDK